MPYPVSSSRWPAVPPDPGTAKRYLVWLLSRREYSQAALRQKALGKGHDADEVERALADLARLNLQSDERYARSAARQAAVRKGDRQVARLLAAQHIGTDVTQQALDTLPCELDRAWRLAERYAGQSLTAPLRQTIWRRLASRGFSGETIRAVVTRLHSGSPKD